MSTARERHEALIPMGTQVTSKRRLRNCAGFGPEWIVCGLGAYVFDQHNTRYLDWSCGLGALTIGHESALVPGHACLPLPHPVELDLAEHLQRWIPGAEAMRFLKNGTDATSAAIRIARVFTGKDRIVDAGTYHGCADWSIDPQHEGVPAAVRALTTHVPYNDAEAVEDQLLKGDVAAVILEPVTLIPPNDWYLITLQRLCRDHGAVLIFDEVITGIRMAKGGAAEVYRVTPDLTCIGKGLANGAPISAICGRRDIMQCWERTHLSGTHFADPSCMQAAINTMSTLAARDFWTHQNEIGGCLMRGVETAIQTQRVQDVVSVLGHPHWWVVKIPDPVLQTLVQQELIRKGVLGSNGSHFVSLAHTYDHVMVTIQAYHHAFAVLRRALDDDNAASRLECVVNVTTFKRQQ